VGVAEPVAKDDGLDVGVEVRHSKEVGDADVEALADSVRSREPVAPSVEDALFETEEETEGEGVDSSVPEMLPVRDALWLLEGDRSADRDADAEAPLEGELHAVPDPVGESRVEGDVVGEGEKEGRESRVDLGDGVEDSEGVEVPVCEAEDEPPSNEAVAHAVREGVGVPPPVTLTLTLGDPDCVTASSGVELTVVVCVRVSVATAESEGPAVVVAGALLVDVGDSTDVGDWEDDGSVETLKVPLPANEKDSVPVKIVVPVSDGAEEAEPVAAADCEAVANALEEGVAPALGDEMGEGVADAVPDVVPVDAAVFVCVIVAGVVCEAEAVVAALCVPVAAPDRLADAEALAHPVEEVEMCTLPLTDTEEE